MCAGDTEICEIKKPNMAQIIFICDSYQLFWYSLSWAAKPLRPECLMPALVACSRSFCRRHPQKAADTCSASISALTASSHSGIAFPEDLHTECDGNPPCFGPAGHLGDACETRPCEASSSFPGAWLSSAEPAPKFNIIQS